ncbi:MAG: DUF4180 domain-containing protein [Chloroflexi bacterium]|nr:DUF4180 domain-containing protein [Chloroflexota bacterium]
MSYELIDLAGQRCLFVAAEEPCLGTVRQVTDLIGDAMGEDAFVIAVQASALDPSFFDLRSGFAGEVLQKAVNYGRKFAVVGDVSTYTAASRAFHDLVVESAYSRGYFFVPDLDALAARLTRLEAG